MYILEKPQYYVIYVLSNSEIYIIFEVDIMVVRLHLLLSLRVRKFKLHLYYEYLTKL